MSELAAQLGQSTLILAPSAAWPQIWGELGTGLHPADRWTPEEWSKLPAIKDIRQAQHFAAQGAVGAGKQLALPLADQWSKEVANSLLKLLEEPPANVQLVLFAESDRILPTIRSRVRILKVEAVAGEDESGAQRLATFYRSLDPDTQPALTKRFLYYAPLFHATIQTDTVLDAFQS
jgi:hypothetical protein